MRHGFDVDIEPCGQGHLLDRNCDLPPDRWSVRGDQIDFYAIWVASVSQQLFRRCSIVGNLGRVDNISVFRRENVVPRRAPKPLKNNIDQGLPID